MKRVSLCGSAAVAVALLAMAGRADAATGHVAVRATVNNVCVVTNSPSLAFGSVNPADSLNVDQTGIISIACTKGAVAKVALDGGANPGKGLSGSRAMSDGAGDFLGYEIYQNSTRTTVWGSGAGAKTEPAATSIAPVSYTAYGRIPAANSNQAVPANTYNDTVGITVTF